MSPENGSVGAGFTEGELKFASFWVRNRLALQRGIVISLISFNVALWGYALWGFVDAYAVSYPRESRIIQNIVQNQITLEALDSDRPQNIQSGNVVVLQSTDGRYDMAVDLENPNAQWWAEFTYRFNFSGEQTAKKSGFILPGGRMTVTELGYRPKGRGGPSAQFVVEDIRWRRIDPSQVGVRYADYALQHFNVAFENITYQNDLTLGTQQIGRTSFDVVNRGSYGYWGLDIVIKLFRGSNMVGVNKMMLSRLVPGEARHVDVDWFERIPGVTRTEIMPAINLLDPTVFLPTDQFRAP